MKDNHEQQDNEQFDLNMDNIQYGPQRIDQSFIPDTWVQSTEKKSRLYYDTPIYVDTVTGHTIKRPLSRNAYELLKTISIPEGLQTFDDACRIESND